MNTPRTSGNSQRTFVLHFIAIFLGSVACIATAFSIFAYQRFQLQQEERQHTESVRLALAAKVVTHNLQQLIVDLGLLTESQYLQDYLEDASPRNTARLEKDFINLAKQTALYDQIRIIDRSGRERIRINFNNGKPQAVALDQLQDKSTRYYFRESIRLPPGHIYLSPLDLNVENGVIEQPFKPMIRVATPLFDPRHKQTTGVLVLNFLAARLLNQFQEAMTESWGSAMILNREGYWLYSPKHEDEWGFMRGNTDTFATRYPLSWTSLLNSNSGNVRTQEGLFTFTTLRPSVIAPRPSANVHKDAMLWRLVSRVAPDELAFSFWRSVREHSAVTLWLLLLTALLSFLLAWLRTNNIVKSNALTAAVAKQRQAATAFNNTMEAIIITDSEHKIIAVNQAYSKITGYESDEVIGKTPRLHQSKQYDEAFYQNLWHTVAHSGHWQGEIWNRRKDGQLYPAWENISVVRDERGQISNYVSVFSDISSIKQTEARLSQLAHHDALTGLANRLAFNLNLEQALERAKRHHHKVALLFLDLDRFKLINDTLGHASGDSMLRIIAERLKHSVRAEDMVARIGGDEFTIVLEEITQTNDAATLAQKLIRAIAEPMQLNDQEIVITTSIGLSIYPDDANTAADLAKAADAAMYRAKARGRHTFEFYTSELTDHAIQKLSTENNLRQALARDELMLYFQPQIDVATGKLSGVEALLRWQHPQLGLLLPEQFIRIAEESQLIDHIGVWVLHQACAQTRSWRDAGLPRIRIAVNLSARQIMYDSTVDAVQHALDVNGLKPTDVLFELEITESVLQSEEQIIEPLRQLRQLGISIAIDDFGTGYSSLSHLKQLPIDTLKIDRAFMRNIPQDANNKAITTAIISMGHSLGLRVIAEGIETQAQLQFLKRYACDEAQGFLFSEAVPPEDFEKFLKQGRLPSNLMHTVEVEK
jgi:diguanylate cyclase (GGDEF)-like protein/PAS domain S-box-containing protein